MTPADGGGMGGSNWQDWTGRTSVEIGSLTLDPARRLAALLGRTDAPGIRNGTELPPLWNWLYFVAVAPAAEIGPDGHPKRGGFLPPVDLPRRMWAGSRCSFHGPMRIGDEVTKVSTILKVETKSGRTGEMVFVTVRHDISRGGETLYEEDQDIVYMAIPDRFAPPDPVPVPACEHVMTVSVDPVVLFRFSAVTFNGHRIHYDRDYAITTEKYPGLVVHGPLQAIWLMEAAKAWFPDRRPATFRFRGMRPLFDFDTVNLHGGPNAAGELDLFTANADGAISMKAFLTWDESA